ncbi:MAG: thermonuclease family protein [Candidatus Gottesmanbacteria bacterium]|nr:thermonuclease family protein [Candidatus Gottesmanbacteria bacterium]
MRKRLTGFWWIPLFVFSVVLNLFLLLRGQFIPSGVRVIGVIDGDTFVLEGKSKVRLRYVDAPELAFCGGLAAKSYLEKLVVGKNVRIEEQIPDQYGRGMALVYQGNTLVNREMLESGWARYHSDISSVTDEMKKAAGEAKNNSRGIYGACQSKDIPDNPNCVIKGNIDTNSDARTYYLPTCAQYKFTIVEKDIGEGWFCTEKEALAAGFTKAATCKQ